MTKKTQYYYIGEDSSMINIPGRRKIGFTGRSQIILAAYRDDETSSF